MNPNQQEAKKTNSQKTCLLPFPLCNKMSSSLSQDPRREEAIVPFHLPRRNDEEEDWSSMLATLVCKLKSIARLCFK